MPCRLYELRNCEFQMYLDELIVVLFIDIWNYSRSNIEYEEHMRIVLQHLREEFMCQVGKGRMLASEGFVVRPCDFSCSSDSGPNED